MPDGITLDDLLALGENILPDIRSSRSSGVDGGSASKRTSMDALDPLRLAAAIAKLAPSKAEVGSCLAALQTV